MTTSQSASGGSRGELPKVFAAHRVQLRRMVELRMDRRLNGRIDASDVIQEAYFEAWRRFGEWEQHQKMPLFLWLRFLSAQKLNELHRRHLRTKARDANRDVSIDQSRGPAAASRVLAGRLAAQIDTPSAAVAGLEVASQVQQALDSMDEIDREVLALRHFEQLNNREAATVLGIDTSAASKRYVRALKRLQELLVNEFGLSGGIASVL